MTKIRTPLVVADLGGTNLRLARLDDGHLRDSESYATASFPGIDAGLRHYLEKHRLERALLCLAVASPVLGDEVRMTNLDWQFSRTALERALGLEELVVINDYTATAMAVPFLRPDQKRQIGQGAPREGSPIAVCGPGTGLGVAHLVSAGQQWIVLDGEGGHVDFAPADEMEQKIQNIFGREFGHVSTERILSGPGLSTLYRAICEIRGVPAEAYSAEQISTRAIEGSCNICKETLARFCAMLGSFCGDLALTLATFGGVYIAGGIIPDMLGFFQNSDFRRRFEAKGRYQQYNSAIPTYVITAPSPGLDGAAAWLRQMLAARN